MAGQIKKMIDSIILQKAKGDQSLTYLTQAKLALKGVNIKHYDENSDDDPVIIEKLRQIAKDFGVTV